MSGWADLKSSFDVIIHHLNVGLVHTDGAAGQTAGLVDGHIVKLRTVVPALLKDQQDLLHYCIDLIRFGFDLTAVVEHSLRPCIKWIARGTCTLPKQTVTMCVVQTWSCLAFRCNRLHTRTCMIVTDCYFMHISVDQPPGQATRPLDAEDGTQQKCTCARPSATTGSNTLPPLIKMPLTFSMNRCSR